jgi:hypothetical protein
MAHNPIFITVRHVRSLFCGALSLTTGRVCNLLLQFAVTLESNPEVLMTTSHFLILDSPNLEGQGQGGPVINPDTEFPFCRLL